MKPNYTLRDLIVYFSTGVIFTLFLIFFFSNEIGAYLTNTEIIENYKVLFSIILIPAFYLIGHIIAAIDYTFLFRLSNFIIKKTESDSFMRKIFSNYRIHGIQAKNWNYNFNFWDVVVTIQKNKLYDRADYWYTLNDFLKNHMIIFLIFLAVSIIKGEYITASILFIMLILIYDRAKFFGTNFVLSIIRLHKEISADNITYEFPDTLNSIHFNFLADYNDAIKIWKRNKIKMESIKSEKEQKYHEYFKSKPKSFIVAKKKNKIIGIAVFFINDRKACIERIAVDREYRNKGISDLLVKHCENLVKLNNIDRLTCLVENSNSRSKSLFKRLDYKEYRNLTYFVKNIK